MARIYETIVYEGVQQVTRNIYCGTMHEHKHIYDYRRFLKISTT